MTRPPHFLGFRLLFVALLAGLALASCIMDAGEEPGEPGEPVLDGEIPPPSTTTAVEPHRRSEDPPWAVGELQSATTLFGDSELDRAVLRSNPRLYLRPGFDPARPTTLVIGLPGWGGRSENFVWTLINGISEQGLGSNLALAAIQDTRHGGPRYQGQGSRRHANTWYVTPRSVEVMTHFVSVVSRRLGPTRVFFLGYSTGGVSAPIVASRVPNREEYRVEGAVVLGTGSSVAAQGLRRRGQRVLFVVVPQRRAGEGGRILRDDQWNREQAEATRARLAAAGVVAHLRHIPSARLHRDWHWGLISPCRYFPGQRVDDGRGYWPNYWMPNPQTSEVVSAFLRGEAPPVPPERFAPLLCPS